MDEKKREQIALFRYSLIVPFLSQQELEWGVKGELLQRMVKEITTIPFSQKHRWTNQPSDATLKLIVKKDLTA